MLYLYLALPAHYTFKVDKKYHWFVLSDKLDGDSHFCILNLASKNELHKCLYSSLAVCDGLFITHNISSTLDFKPSQSISIQKDFIFVPSRYKNKFDLFAFDTELFISRICNALNLK